MVWSRLERVMRRKHAQRQWMTQFGAFLMIAGMYASQRSGRRTMYGWRPTRHWDLKAETLSISQSVIVASPLQVNHCSTNDKEILDSDLAGFRHSILHRCPLVV